MRALALEFRALSEEKLSFSHGYQFFALLSMWFSAVGIDDFSHTRNGLHPCSMGPLRYVDSRNRVVSSPSANNKEKCFFCSPGDRFVGRVAFLRNNSTIAFLEYLRDLEGDPFRIGQGLFRLERSSLTSCYSGLALLESALPRDLICRGEKEREQNSLCMRFYTPTGFKKDDAQYLLPLAPLVFGSLLRRWRSWIDSSAWENMEACFEKILISGISIVSHSVQLKKRAVYRGFTGTVRYDLHRCTLEEKAVLHTLGLFAAYAGVGYKTSQGMGEAAKLSETYF